MRLLKETRARLRCCRGLWAENAELYSARTYIHTTASHEVDSRTNLREAGQPPRLLHLQARYLIIVVRMTVIIRKATTTHGRSDVLSRPPPPPLRSAWKRRRGRVVFCAITRKTKRRSSRRCIRQESKGEVNRERRGIPLVSHR